MTLNEIYAKYKSEKEDGPRKSVIKAVYVFNGGKRLKLETPLDYGMYKALCGYRLVNKEIQRYNRTRKPKDRQHMQYLCMDLVRIFVQSVKPNILKRETIANVHDNKNAIAVKVKGTSAITVQWFDETLILETGEDYMKYLTSLLWLEGRLAILLFRAIGFEHNSEELLNIANGFGKYIK